jgi:signal peptidase II
MFLYAVAFGLTVLDQVSKFVVLQNLELGQSIPVVPSVLYFTLVQNTGIAFGLFQNNPMLLTYLISFCVLLLALYSIRIRKESKIEQLAFALILGGAVGNLIDRVRLGWVVDFIDFRIWPVFNIADSGITIGVVLLAWKLLFHPRGASHG